MTRDAVPNEYVWCRQCGLRQATKRSEGALRYEEHKDGRGVPCLASGKEVPHGRT